MILLDKVLHVRILSRQFFCLLRQELFLRHLAITILHYLSHFLRSNLVAHITLFHIANNSIVMIFKRFQHLTLLHQDDVIAIRRLDNTRHLARLQGIGRILKLLHQLSALNKRQQTTLTGRTWVLRHTLSQLFEVCTILQCIIDRVYANLGCIPLRLRSLLLRPDQDMSDTNHAIGTNLLNRLVIDLMSLSLHISISHESRTYLLVTILGKLGLERRQRIVFSFQSSSHL